jgi:hypothetical protein
MPRLVIKPTKGVFSRLFRRFLVVFLSVALFGAVAQVNNQLQSASLTSVSVTLSNSRLSFRGGLAAGNTAGSSTVILNTTPGAYPSTSSAQLVEGDTLLIGEAGSLGTYTVASTSSLSTFTIKSPANSALLAGDSEAADDVIASNSSSLTVRFTTANAIAGGRFRILVPSLTSDTAAADGIPDGGYFDFGASAPTVTCPTDITGYDFVTGTATASTITINTTDYHAYECAYSGAGASGTAFNGTTNDAITISNIINPAPGASHTTGTADTYGLIVQHINSSFAVADNTAVGIGVIEAVKVTATVDPQITFQIIGLATGTSACGVNTGVTTTAASVPFGNISISAFTNAAQALTVSTNASSGFTVTAVENDQLGRNGGVCTGDNTGQDCIRDSVGDGGAMTHAVSAEWTSASAKGFAYSLHDVNSSTTEAFAYTTATGNCTGTYCARQFADAEDSQSAVSIFSSSTVADNQNLYVCYRIIANTTTAAGNYENYLTYTATATF